jgi:hypothetical protein
MSENFYVNLISLNPLVLEKIFEIYSLYAKRVPLMWPHPTPGVHYFNKLESVLCKKAFMQISALLV